MFVVTGGGSGIGIALALELAKQGKKVLIVGRNQARLSVAAANSSLISYCVADVTSEQDRKKILNALKDVNDLDGLIHNSGRIDPICSLKSIQEKDWNAVLNLNLTAPLFLSQLLLPKLTKARILHIGSGAAYFPVRGWGAYCVSKAALAMLTRCLLKEDPELAIASVMPGIIDTPIQDIIRESQGMDKEKQDFFINLKTTQCLIKPETVAIFLVWLLLSISKNDYVAKEWDIYDIAHHKAWLKLPHVVPALED